MIQGHYVKSTKNTHHQLIKHSIRFTIRLGEIWKRPTHKSKKYSLDLQHQFKDTVAFHTGI